MEWNNISTFDHVFLSILHMFSFLFLNNAVFIYQLLSKNFFVFFSTLIFVCVCSELEQYVVSLQKDSAATNRVVTLKDVEEGAVTLRKVGESLAGLKGKKTDAILTAGNNIMHNPVFKTVFI